MFACCCATLMNCQARSAFGEFDEIESSQPPRTLAIPGLCPLIVGMGATAMVCGACSQQGPQVVFTQDSPYQLPPTAIAMLPCWSVAGRLTMAFGSSSCD